MMRTASDFQLESWRPRILRGLSGKRIYLNGKPYLTRYYLLGDGSGKGYEVYLHHIQREDPYRWLHNHPWRWFLSIVLRGGYKQEVLQLPGEGPHKTQRVRFINLFRGQNRYHAITELPKKGAWTLVIVPPKMRESRRWGYWNEDAKVHEPDSGDESEGCETIRFGTKQTFN